MKLEVKNLVYAAVGEKETFNVELFKEELDEEITAERIKVEIKLTRLEEQLLATFSGSAKVKLFCDRCLTEYTLEMPLKFSQEYVLNRAEETPEKPAVSSHFEIEVQEPLRQEILAAVPVKKICQSECKGICADCGKNLNLESCKCKKAGRH